MHSGHRAQQLQFCKWALFPRSQHYCALGTAKVLTRLYSVTTERLQSHQSFNRDATVDQTIASLLQIWELQQFSFIITHPSNWTSRAIPSGITLAYDIRVSTTAVHGYLERRGSGNREWFEGLFKILNTFLYKKYKLYIGLNLLLLL